ncbi:MAG: CopD family protein [Pseudohongiella sp.]|nr:CopD family protein [Pseudohongiella sp.]
MSTWELASVLSKTLIYLGMLAVAGGMLVLWMNRQHQTAVQIIVRAYLLPVTLVGLLATCLFFLIQIGSVNQNGFAGMFDPLMGSILAETEVGSAIRWRLIGFLLALIALIPFNLPGFPFQHLAARRFCLFVTLAALTCFVIAVTSQGHASAVSRLAELLTGIHVLAIACWAGSLYPLYLLVGRNAGAGQFPHTEELSDTAVVLERFGFYAWWMLGLMLLTGVSLICLLKGGLLTLFDNLHGQLLFAKILLVAGMMALGALHKFRWVPRLRECAHSGADTQAVLLALSRSIRLEMLLALLVLLLTATLTSVTGPGG